MRQRFVRTRAFMCSFIIVTVDAAAAVIVIVVISLLKTGSFLLVIFTGIISFLGGSGLLLIVILKLIYYFYSWRAPLTYHRYSLTRTFLNCAAFLEASDSAVAFRVADSLP